LLDNIGNLDVNADATGKIVSVAAGLSGSAKGAGLAGSVAAGGKITVKASNDGLLITPAISGSFTSGGGASTDPAQAGGGKFGIAFSGSASTHSVTDTTLAFVRDANITQASGLLVDAHEKTRIFAVGGSAALSLNAKGSGGIAGALTLNTIDNTTHAFIENSLLDNIGNLDVNADATGKIVSVAAGLSGSAKGAGLAGSVEIPKLPVPVLSRSAQPTPPRSLPWPALSHLAAKAVSVCRSVSTRSIRRRLRPLQTRISQPRATSALPQSPTYASSG
jgi:hypothetical protein